MSSANGVFSAARASNQLTAWQGLDLGRTGSGCGNDALDADPVVRHASQPSTPPYSGIVYADEVYVGTRYQSDGTCTTGQNTQNRVYAIDPRDGTVNWVYNQSGLVNMDIVSGLVLDESTGILYSATERTYSTAQHSVWAIDTATGTLAWSVNANRIQTKPLLRGSRLYVATLSGAVTALNAADGSQAWSLPLGIPVNIDPAMGTTAPYDDLVAVVDLFGRVRLIRDDGTTGALLWTSELPIGPTTNTGLATIKAVSAPIIDDNGYLYVGASDGKLYQLDIATGNVGPTRLVDSTPTSVSPLAVQTPAQGGTTPYSLVAYSFGGELARFCAPFMYPPGTYVADGDVNVDGSVDVRDVLLGTQVALGSKLLNPEQFGHGDVAPLVSGVPAPDGDFGLPDVLLIARKALGLAGF